MRKPAIWFLNRSDSNQAVQALKMAGKNLERNCTIHVVKTKELINFALTVKLICAFVLACAKCLVFS